ncbi:DUF4298 domain-containing protein [Tenacibaculum dicentrarchi]|nr:DUF4298 domain-containing protein [Tenacibaculum dicentrarchi]MCD8414895.1 DUF4298 domain-containing protein [Tenacibaculum dicentrarchi]MCD8420019.1 DUF4298 domain-containing protein [Tenacibaculum dicentrarchi]MCD8425054.1 DUF4298 domain-containing protein [Tenacibaculum dicentrarchi]MCD8435091.1 DUF4298 domain-containing protein [Tenacibaculum dicentrarchi]
MNNNDAIKEEFKEMDSLLFEVEKEFIQIKKHHKKLKKLIQKTKILEEFYFSEKWMKNRDLLTKSSKNNTEPNSFYSASEDAIWNLSQSLHTEKIKILKTITKTL